MKTLPTGYINAFTDLTRWLEAKRLVKAGILRETIANYFAEVSK